MWVWEYSGKRGFPLYSNEMIRKSIISWSLFNFEKIQNSSLSLELSILVKIEKLMALSWWKAKMVMAPFFVIFHKNDFWQGTIVFCQKTSFLRKIAKIVKFGKNHRISVVRTRRMRNWRSTPKRWRVENLSESSVRFFWSIKKIVGPNRNKDFFERAKKIIWENKNLFSKIIATSRDIFCQKMACGRQKTVYVHHFCAICAKWWFCL